MKNLILGLRSDFSRVDNTARVYVSLFNGDITKLFSPMAGWQSARVSREEIRDLSGDRILPPNQRDVRQGYRDPLQMLKGGLQIAIRSRWSLLLDDWGRNEERPKHVVRRLDPESGVDREPVANELEDHSLARINLPIYQ
jgi:hypothetical protein